MQLMQRAGCWQIAYGIESGSQRVLDVVKREVRIPRMRETLRMTRAAGIRAKGYLMIGHPTEGLDSLDETAAFLRTVELDLCQITKFTPYPGTPAYPTIREHGTFVEDWERMNAMNFVFIPQRPDARTSSRRTSTTATAPSTAAPTCCGAWPPARRRAALHHPLRRFGAHLPAQQVRGRTVFDRAPFARRAAGGGSGGVRRSVGRFVDLLSC